MMKHAPSRALVCIFLVFALLQGCAATVTDSEATEEDKEILTASLIIAGGTLTISLVLAGLSALGISHTNTMILDSDEIAVQVSGPRWALNRASALPGVTPTERVRWVQDQRDLLAHELGTWSQKEYLRGSPAWVMDQLTEAERFGGQLHYIELRLPNRARELPNREAVLVISGPQRGILTETIQAACQSFTGNPQCTDPDRLQYFSIDGAATQLKLVDTSGVRRPSFVMATANDNGFSDGVEEAQAIRALQSEEMTISEYKERDPGASICPGDLSVWGDHSSCHRHCIANYDMPCQ